MAKEAQDKVNIALPASGAITRWYPEQALCPETAYGDIRQIPDKPEDVLYTSFDAKKAKFLRSNPLA